MKKDTKTKQTEQDDVEKKEKKKQQQNIYSNDVSVNKMSKTTAIKTGKSYIYRTEKEKKKFKINSYEKKTKLE